MTRGARAGAIWIAALALACGAAAQLPRPLLEKTRLDNPTGNGSDAYGASAAIANRSIAVGARRAETPIGGDNGAVYLFDRPASGWTLTPPVAQLYAQNGTAGASFGEALAMDGDTVVVGASLAKPAGTQTRTGFAYVFERPSSGWEDMPESAQLEASDATNSGLFGFAVAVSGTTAFASFPGAPPNSQGAIYVFERPAGGWSGGMTQTAALRPSDGVASSFMGLSLDVDQDTVVTESQNAIYIFERPSTGWVDATETAKLIPATGSYLDGWVHGDTLVARHLTTGFVTSLFVFGKGPNGWSDAVQVATLTPSAGNGPIGPAIAVSEDRVVAGWSAATVGGNTLQGHALVWDKPSTGWVDASETFILTASDGAADHQFGAAVALDGPAALVAALGVGGSFVGSAYVLDQPAEVPRSGCAQSPVGMLGSTRLGAAMVVFQTQCTAESSLGIAIGTPFLHPVRFANLATCGDTSNCLLSCNPTVLWSGVGNTFTIEASPSLVGTTFCVQGMCVDPAGPCIRTTNMSVVTISQ